ncbi:RNA-binding protein 40 [Portunus trituberculatus]|uniref:RNA-binding region-containing protein 3 n=1 Tax=Portunus trituberculatus TaxID=210409 RepID=A0A5B7E4I1_PORTR|nr:RNA-binding protein 40 [Portunus trituberculatus]
MFSCNLPFRANHKMPTELKVWSFHKSISKTAMKDLLRHFGARTVQLARHHRKDAVLASFASEADCRYALEKLHQHELLGVRLKAMYWDSALTPSQQPHRCKENEKHDNVTQEEKTLKKMKEFEVNLCSIAPALGVHHPIIPRLRYLYPPPSPCVIGNIAQTLIEVPKFYTQVLHLMNKMNLPAPFQPVQDLYPLYQNLSEVLWSKGSDTVDKSIIVEGKSEEGMDSNHENTDHESSETESELESEGEVQTNVKIRPVPIKRRLKPTNTIRKRPKFSLLKQASVPHPRTPEFSVRDVFEGTEAQGSRKLELKLKNTILPQDRGSTRADSPRERGTFGKIKSLSAEIKPCPSESMVEWEREADKYIKREEILNNRVAKSEWPILPVFKNYTAGEPSVKLYIKNLAKTTTEEDLKFIFGRYVFWQNEEEAKQFSISLMKEGRMKGQAFITFPKKEQASEALEDVNGYILNDKPMVIAFGKVKKEHHEDSSAKERSEN